jgi:CheY-like chemotaxis protein
MPKPIIPHGTALLVVEDDALVRVTLVDVLTCDGFDVLEAEDAAGALDLICTRPEIAALLTDINLPGGADGFALAQAVRVVRPGLPVLYASGRCTRGQSGKAVAGARFLAKPFTPWLAARALRELIDEPVMPPPVPPATGRRRVAH